MGVGLVAREAYYKVHALEQALISKGILIEGEVAQLYNNELRKHAEEETKCQSELWDKLSDGIEVKLFPYMAKPLFGVLVGKSTSPWKAICLRITDRGSYHKHYKRGEVICFTDFSPSDVSFY